MLDVETRRRIDTARDILVGRVPDPKSQVEQITLALMYKFMDDMDVLSESMGGKASFFAGDFARYSWRNIVGPRIGAYDAVNTYSDGITRMGENPGLPTLFRSMFSNAYLPFRDPETLRSFLQVIGEFEYENSERLGDAFEYLLSIMGSQGDAGQFRTPRHIIDFIVEIIDPKKDEIILDPACGTAGFLISAYKHILGTGMHGQDGQDVGLTPGEKAQLVRNVRGYDISPDMVRLSLVNLYLHGFPDPDIFEYDTLTSDDRWNQYANVILANPPFMSPKGGIRPHNRFSVTSRRSEVLFVDYIAEHLTPNGRAGVIVPEGIIFQSQNAHKQLRKMLVEEYLVAVVSLPPGVFNPYSGVKTSILILDKSLARQSDTIGFFKVENDGFDLGAQRRAVDRDDLPSVKADVKEYLRLVREGIYMDERDGEDVSYEFETGLVVEKERIGEDGEFNLSGERYGISEKAHSEFPFVPVEGVFQRSRETVLPASLNGSVTYIGLENLEPHTGRLVGELTEDDPSSIKSSKNVFCSGDILYGKLRPNLNKVWFADREGICSSDIFVIEPINDDVVPGFYEHVFRSEQFNLEALKRLSGAQLPRISWQALAAIEVPLPPIEVQREIVSEIEGYQKVIDGARAVVENWRPRIAVDPEWPVVELGDVAQVIAGQSPPGSSYNAEGVGDPFYQGKTEFGDDYIGEPVKWTTDPRRFAEDTDILMSVRAPVGPVNLTKERVCIGRGLAAIRPENGDLLKDYAYYALRMLEPQISGNTGTAFASINMRDIKRIPFPLPDAATQKVVATQIRMEQEWVDASRRLIEVMEAKVQGAVGRVWGE